MHIPPQVGSEGGSEGGRQGGRHGTDGRGRQGVHRTRSQVEAEGIDRVDCPLTVNDDRDGRGGNNAVSVRFTV